LSSGCGSPAPAESKTSDQGSGPKVTVSQPLTRDITDFDSYEGRIESVETVQVRARVRGYLTKVNFKDGQIVKPGELLYEIDPRPYQATLDGAQAQVAAADAALDLAKKEYARAVSLLRSNAASREEVDTWTGKQGVAKADRLKALAAVEQAKLDLDFTKVTAPINGMISRTLADVGNLINASGGETLLTTIVSVDPMYVYFEVDERALLRYRKEFDKNKTDDKHVRPPIKELKIPVEVRLEGDEGYPHKGVIDFADNIVNPSTGTIKVRGVLPNVRRILDAGMRARVRIPVSDPHKVLLVTARAVANDQGRKLLYVVDDKDVVKRRNVKLGRFEGSLQVILEGLKTEEWVIVDGIQFVRDEMKVNPERVPMPGGATSSGVSQPPLAASKPDAKN
jgi:RND family efflux transporter MFP subunit